MSVQNVKFRPSGLLEIIGAIGFTLAGFALLIIISDTSYNRIPLLEQGFNMLILCSGLIICAPYILFRKYISREDSADYITFGSEFSPYLKIKSSEIPISELSCVTGIIIVKNYDSETGRREQDTEKKVTKLMRNNKTILRTSEGLSDHIFGSKKGEDEIRMILPEIIYKQEQDKVIVSRD
jgi:hypothetical protein